MAAALSACGNAASNNSSAASTTAEAKKDSQNNSSENKGAAGNSAAGSKSADTSVDAKSAGSAAKSTGADSGELTEIVFSLDWTPNTNHTGLFVADQLGYYEEAGLDVQIVQPPENGAALMCAAGQAQFAVECQDTMAPSIDLDEPLGITAVAAILQHNTSGIMSRAGEGMDRPAGMTGKTYSTWEIPVEIETLRTVVDKDGGDFEQVKLIPNDITDEAAALQAKQTDAIWVFYGWGGINAKTKGVDIDFFYFKDLDPVFDYYTPLIIANNDFLAEHPDTARAFLSATKKGYEYAAKHPAEAAEMLIAGDTTGSLEGSEDFVLASQEFLSGMYIDDAASWGVFDEARWNAFYKWLYDNGLSENDLTKGQFFTNEFLE
ncbi:MAG: ABC transporter substrate-binding protein [Eubacterium sp.]|nr:ABC transporter substrate-binding protein [Eubacterium sp.]